MKTTWDTFRKELAIHGFRVVHVNLVQYWKGTTPVNSSADEAIAMIGSEIGENEKVIKELWDNAKSILEQPSTGGFSHDSRLSKLFIFSIKDLLKLLVCFDENSISGYGNTFRQTLDREVSSFHPSQ